MMPWIVEVKTPKEIELMRAAGRVAREVLDIAGQAVRVGITTDEIDHLVHAETIKVRSYESHPCVLYSKMVPFDSHKLQHLSIKS